jgi:hypothetical protein
MKEILLISTEKPGAILWFGLFSLRCFVLLVLYFNFVCTIMRMEDVPSVLLWMPLWLVDWHLYLQGLRPVYLWSLICVRVCSTDLRRITLVLMHILIQPPSSYKSSFSYKTSDGAETHDPSTHATITIMCFRVIFHVPVAMLKIGVPSRYEC